MTTHNAQRADAKLRKQAELICTRARTDFLTTQEAATALQVSQARVNQLVDAEEIIAIKLGGVRLIPRKWFEQWIQSRNTQPGRPRNDN